MNEEHTYEKKEAPEETPLPSARRYFPGTNCGVTLKNAQGATKTLHGKRTATGTLYIKHGEGWRNAEKYAKKMGVEIVR